MPAKCLQRPFDTPHMEGKCLIFTITGPYDYLIISPPAKIKRDHFPSIISGAFDTFFPFLFGNL